MVLATVGTVLVVACQVRGGDRAPLATRHVIGVGERESVEVTRLVTERELVEVTGEPRAAADRDHLTVCMSREPETLYWYGEGTPARAHVLHGIYDVLYLEQSYAYQAHGLARLPDLEQGDASVNEVEVTEGTWVSDADGNLVTLAPGVSLLDANGDRFEYSGGIATTVQMVVDFELNPMIWEDGTPVTARDSVYSFELAAAPDTAVVQFDVAHTESYVATERLATRWTGVPGWLDDSYFLNAWQPLPRHAWGQLPPAELLEVAVSNRHPLSYGPFRLKEWVAGDRITLVRNEHYWRDGYPRLESVTFRFIPDSKQLLAELLARQCDIGTQDGIDVGQSPFLLESQRQGLLVPHFQTGTVYEHVAFGINPVQGYDETRPDWFEDVRVRQAMTLCTDRQRMVDELLYGQSDVVHSYVPEVHPLFPKDDLIRWPYDPHAGRALLDEIGVVDNDGDGVREYHASTDLAGADAQWDGEPFVVTLGASAGYRLGRELSEMFRQDMADCGIQIMPYYPSSVAWFADGPDGVLFGRRFDLGQFAWLAAVEPPCQLYVGWNIPGSSGVLDGSGRPRYPSGWAGQNVMAWRNAAFDRACRDALDSLPGTEEYQANHREAQRIFARSLPVIPLFLRLKVAVTRPDVQNFHLDPTQKSELYNLFEIELNTLSTPQ